MRVIEDIEHILAERRGLDRPFELQSTDVFFRVEAMAIATEITRVRISPNFYKGRLSRRQRSYRTNRSSFRR